MESPAVTPSSENGKATKTQRVVIITGASSGLGLAAAKAMVADGNTHVVMACRDYSKAELAAKVCWLCWLCGVCVVWCVLFVSRIVCVAYCLCRVLMRIVCMHIVCIVYCLCCVSAWIVCVLCVLYAIVIIVYHCYSHTVQSAFPPRCTLYNIFILVLLTHPSQTHSATVSPRTATPSCTSTWPPSTRSRTL